MCLEMKDAINWLFSMLKDYAGVTSRSQTLRLEAVNTDSEDGRGIEDAARRILGKVGEPDAEEITLDQVRWIKTQVESTPVSEAGVVLPEAASEEDIEEFITDIIASIGGIPHPGGAQGIGQVQLDQFLNDVAAYLEWHERGLIPAGEKKTAVMPLGQETQAAYSILTSVRGKIDQYFAQCEAVALDESFVQRMGWTKGELENLDFDDPVVIEDVLKKAPLARAKPDRLLRFDDGINPYYTEIIGAFREHVAKPVLGQFGKELTARQWQEIRTVFAAHQAWIDSKPGAKVEQLGVEKLKKYLDKKFSDAVKALVAESTDTAVVLDNIRLVEKLILYQSYMIDLANNFVSFPHLYDPESRAMFETGTLVMDGRRFNLAVKSENRAEHAKVADSSNMYVLYVEVASRDGGQKYEVALPVTSGGKGNLCIGKRGIFCDIDGNLCDARVVHIIENPISVREALVSPFRRLGRMLTGKIESITASAEKKFEAKAATSISRVAPEPGAAPPPAQLAAPQAGGMSGGAGLLLGGGLAIAALGSAVAFITKTLADTSWVAIVIGVFVAVFIVMLPMSIVAFLKLRKQDISAILEGSGWAINARMRLTHRQRRFFTKRPRYPRGAKGIPLLPWRLILVVLIIAVLAAGGYFLRRYMRQNQPEEDKPATVEKAGQPPSGEPASVE